MPDPINWSLSLPYYGAAFALEHVRSLEIAPGGHEGA